MSLARFEFSPSALRQLTRILRESLTDFGPAARARYEILIFQAIDDLLDDPTRPGVLTINGRIHYHIRSSRLRVPQPAGRVGRPRHILIARVMGDRLRILTVAHDTMEEGVLRRIKEGERL